MTKADLTKELLVILEHYTEIVRGIDEGDFSALEKYHITDMVTHELSRVYTGLKKLEKPFRTLEGLSRNMGRIK